MRGLRYILGIEHALCSHVSNVEVYTKANMALNKGDDLSISWEKFIGLANLPNPRQIVKLSDYVMKRQYKALGHIIRVGNDGLMKTDTINPDDVSNSLAT